MITKNRKMYCGCGELLSPYESDYYYLICPKCGKGHDSENDSHLIFKTRG